MSKVGRERLFTDANNSLNVLCQIANFIQDEVHVLSAGLGVDDDHPEKVGLVSLQLVAHHHTALLHHALLHHRRHLQKEGRHTAATDSTDVNVLKHDWTLTAWSFSQSSGPSGRFLRLGGIYQKQTFAYSGCRRKKLFKIGNLLQI